MKRIFTHLVIAVMTVMAITACNERKTRSKLLPNISGTAGEVLVVIEKNYWEGAVGITLRDSLAADCPFLPQPEPLYNLADVVPSGFVQMFQIHRNIIMVNINANVVEPGVVYRRDVWAAPQCVININAPDSDTAVNIIKENSHNIITTIEQAERDRFIANAKRYQELAIAPVAEALVGGSPYFPTGYQLKSRNSEFMWVAYAPQSVQQNILLFKYPVAEGEEMMSRESLTTNVNAILQRNVPGMFDNSYMTIAPAVAPSVKYMKYKGRDFAEIRGLWEVHNDYMGGPFVAHAFYSKDGKEMIVELAFVYAPKYDKRQYLRQIESVLYSFQWEEDESNSTKK